MVINASEVIVNHSRILNRQVIESESGETLGNVSHLWVDTGEHQVLGFTSKAGLFNIVSRSYPWKQIATINVDQITVNVTPEVNLNLALNLDLEVLSTVATRVDWDLWTCSGQHIGKVIDYSFDPITGAVKNYLCICWHRDMLVKHQFHLDPNMITDAGRGWLLVADRVFNEVGLERPKFQIKEHRSIAVA